LLLCDSVVAAGRFSLAAVHPRLWQLWPATLAVNFANCFPFFTFEASASLVPDFGKQEMTSTQRARLTQVRNLNVWRGTTKPLGIWSWQRQRAPSRCDWRLATSSSRKARTFTVSGPPHQRRPRADTGGATDAW